MLYYFLSHSRTPVLVSKNLVKIRFYLFYFISFLFLGGGGLMRRDVCIWLVGRLFEAFGVWGPGFREGS